MRTPTLVIGGLIAALVLTGCPKPPDDAPDSPSPGASSGTSAPLPKPGERSKTKVDADTRLAGPARPRYPVPDDGISGTHLLQTREIRVGGKPLTVWIADTAERRTLGLMHVKDLPEDRGMLFVYPEADRLSFWMKNTYVPLSLAYITGDGRIDQILDMEPHVTRGHPSRGRVRLVLEVNQGWFTRHGVRVGARIPGVEDLRGY